MLKTACLLVVAGLSSRMGCFKPMINLDGKPLIAHVIDTFQSQNIQDTVIVTGYRGDEIENFLVKRHIVFIRNERYGETEMLDSIKLGISYLQNKCDRFFVMPADIPLVQQFSIERMCKFMNKKHVDILQPSYKGKCGHPLLLDARCIPHIMQYHGKNGLRGALNNKLFHKEIIALPDPGLLMDADTPKSYAQIETYYNTVDIPSHEHALTILEWRGVGEIIVRHCLAVEKLAFSLALHAQNKGYALDLRLVKSGALLHDIERKSGKGHAQIGSLLLRKMGYPKVAAVVDAHMDLPQDALAKLDERAIVYLADKLIQEDKCIGIEKRFIGAFDKFAQDEQVLKIINRRMEDAKSILKCLELTEKNYTQILLLGK